MKYIKYWGFHISTKSCDSQPMTLFMFVIFFRLRELNLLISTVKMWHFVRGTVCPVAFCPWDILSCGILSVGHFVLWHFVRGTFCPVAICPVGDFVMWHFVRVTFCPGDILSWGILSGSHYHDLPFDDWNFSIM